MSSFRSILMKSVAGHVSNEFQPPLAHEVLQSSNGESLRRRRALPSPRRVPPRAAALGRDARTTRLLNNCGLNNATAPAPNPGRWPAALRRGARGVTRRAARRAKRRRPYEDAHSPGFDCGKAD